MARTILLAGAAAFVLTGFSQGGISLRRQLVEGDVDTYLVEIRSNQLIYSDMMGQEFPIEMTTFGKVRVKVGKVDEQNKEADVKIEASDLKYDLGMMAAMAGDAESQLPKEFTLSGKINELGEITGVNQGAVGGARGAQMNAMMAMLGGGRGMFPELKFPEKPINIGDTWELPMPPNPMAGISGDQKITAQLVSQRDVDGLLIYVISLKSQNPTNIDMAKVMEAQGDAGAGDMAAMLADMKITGSLESNSTVWVEQATGRIVKHETLQKSKQKVDGGMFMADVNGTITVKMTRVKD